MLFGLCLLSVAIPLISLRLPGWGWRLLALFSADLLFLIYVVGQITTGHSDLATTRDAVSFWLLLCGVRLPAIIIACWRDARLDRRKEQAADAALAATLQPPSTEPAV